MFQSLVSWKTMSSVGVVGGVVGTVFLAKAIDRALVADPHDKFEYNTTVRGSRLLRDAPTNFYFTTIPRDDEMVSPEKDWLVTNDRYYVKCVRELSKGKSTVLPIRGLQLFTPDRFLATQLPLFDAKKHILVTLVVEREKLYRVESTNDLRADCPVVEPLVKLKTRNQVIAHLEAASDTFLPANPTTDSRETSSRIL